MEGSVEKNKNFFVLFIFVIGVKGKKNVLIS